MKRLDLIVGPNGAGKTTFVTRFLAPQLPDSPFVNADVIAAERWPRDQAAHAYEAARIAAEARAALISGGQSFIAETVFSHPSKLELIEAAHAQGFNVNLHVLLVPEEVSVARVPRRVQAGGHDVPETKIRARYRRLWPLVATAIGRVDRARVWDNTDDEGPRLVAGFREGRPLDATDWPAWTPEALRAVSGP